MHKPLPVVWFPGLVVRALVYTLLMGFVYFLLNATLTGHVWQELTISQSALTVEYCEFNNTGAFFHQSMNTYSNLVYFFFGVIICQLGWQDRSSNGRDTLNRMAGFPGLSFLVGGSFIYLSFGSAFFHASLTWPGQRVDMNGTYSLTISLLCVALYGVFHRIVLSERAWQLVVLTVVLLMLALFPLARLVSSSVLLPALILAIWTLVIVNYVQFRRERSALLGVASVVLIIAAFYVRTLDVQKVHCNPFSWYQGHSLWHFLAGLSSFCTYCFFRFDRSSPD